MEYPISKRFASLFGIHKHYQALKAQIAIDGKVHMPVIVWRGEIIDGRARVQAVAELRAEGVEIPEIFVEVKDFADFDAALQYVSNMATSHRNLTKDDVAIIWAEAHIDDIRNAKAEGKRRMAEGGKTKSKIEPSALAPNLDRYDARKVLAKAAGIGQKRADDFAELVLIASDESHPKRPHANELIDGIKNKEYTFTDLQYYLEKWDKRKAKDEARNKIISSGTNDLPTANVPDNSIIAPNSIVTVDWVDGINRIADDSIALTFTSPWYPMVDYGYNGFVPYDGVYANYLTEMERGFRALYQKMISGGYVVIQIDEAYAWFKDTGYRVELPLLRNFQDIMERAGFVYESTLVWYKQTTSGKNGPRNGSEEHSRIRRAYEYMLVFFKEVPGGRGDESLRTILTDEWDDFTIGPWYVRPEQPDKKEFVLSNGKSHPCPYPLDLPYRFIQLKTRKGDVVFDPFNGIGTTTLAAHCTQRKYIGLDREPLFCEKALERIANMREDVAESGISEIDWLRSKLFVRDKGERKDGWGQSNYKGSSIKRRHRPRPRKLKAETEEKD